MTGTTLELLKRNGASVEDFPALRGALAEQLAASKVDAGAALAATLLDLTEGSLSLKECRALQKEISQHTRREGRNINLQLKALRVEMRADRIAAATKGNHDKAGK